MSTNGKVCVKCQIELRPKVNGVPVLGMTTSYAAESYSADIWECPHCGVELFLGFSVGDVPPRRSVVEDPNAYRFWLNQRERDAYGDTYGQLNIHGRETTANAR